MAAAKGPVAEFSSFANFEEKKRKSNLLMSFPKTGNQMGSFGQKRKKSFFRFCRPILDIFGFTLLNLHFRGYSLFNQSESLPGFRVVTSLDSIIAQCLQTSPSRDLLGSFSNDDGDGGDDAGLKMILYFTFECRNSVNQLSTPIGLKMCSG